MKNKGCAPFYLILLLLLFSGCGKVIFKSGSSLTLGGKILPLNGIVLSSPNSSHLIAAAHANITCDSTVYARLYQLKDDGGLEATPFSSVAITSNKYEFTKADLPIDLDTPKVKYQVVIDGCDEVYSRPVTGVNQSQDVTYSSTLIGSVVQTSLSKSLSDANRSEVDKLLNQMSGTSILDAYSNLHNSAALSQEFLQIFSDPPTKLADAHPSVSVSTYPTLVNEGLPSVYKISTIHFDPAYSIAYEWHLDGIEVGSLNQWVFTPGADQAGSYVVTLYVGKSNGSGHVDRSKPFYVHSQNVQVLNTIPATPPTFQIVEPVINHGEITLKVATGTEKENCDSFEKFLITDSNLKPLSSNAGFTRSCSTNLEQTETYTFTATDGLKTISLWAKDRNGNVSGVASTQTILLDSVPPVLTLGTPNIIVKGGNLLDLTLSGQDATSGIHSLKLYYAQDGSAFSEVAQLSNNATTYAWNVPSHNSTSAKLKLIAIDVAGNQANVISNAFTIDSTAPLAPSLTRVSPTPTNSASITLTIGSCLDTEKVFLSENSTTPVSGAAGWIDCSTTVGAFSKVISTGDGTKTLYVWAKDLAGNISSVSSVTTLLDQTPPAAPAIKFASNSSVTELKSSLSTNLTNANCVDKTHILVKVGGSAPTDTDPAWQTCSTSASAISFTLSAAVEQNHFLTAWAKDAAGNLSTSGTNLNFTYDITPPTILSYTLADGIHNVAIPTVNVTISASDAVSGIYQMQLSENITYASNGWVPYSATAYNFNLTQSNGNKTVYLWLKDQAGNISNPSNYAINLDYGNPPVISITSPTSGQTFTAGQTVPISWSCSTSSSAGLAAQPISKIEYTTDDGVTFVSPAIVSNLDNNISSSTGTYNWTLPAGVGMFRLLVSCKSAAGVVSTAFSPVLNSPNWSLFMGDPTNGKTNINALVANAGWTGTTSSVAGDKNNNVFYVKDSALMKIDATTGQVSTFGGSLTTAGCTTAAVPGGFYYTNPKIIGTDATHSNLYLLSCQKIWSINTATAVVTQWLTLPTQPATTLTFLTKNKTLIFMGNDKRVYSANLSTINSTLKVIYGDGTFATTTRYPVGTIVTGLPVPKIGPTSLGNEGFLIANDDASKIWFSIFGDGNGYSIESGDGTTYSIAEADLGVARHNNQNCIRSSFDNYIYCSTRDLSPGGRTIYTFDSVTGALITTGTLPYDDNDNTGNLHLGPGIDRLVATYSLNGVFTVSPSQTDPWTYTRIAGQYLVTMGNGTTPTTVGFDAPVDIKYSSQAQKLFIRNKSGHIRIVDFSTSPYTTSTAVNSFIASFGTDVINFIPNLAGNKFAGNHACGRRYFYNYSLTGTALNYLTSFLSGPCDITTGTVYPPATGSSTTASIFNEPLGYVNPVYHSNGKLYFPAKASTSDVFIFSSNLTTLTRVAGKTGVGGYVAGDHGNAALGASLTYVNQMQEIATGPYAGDLLIWDSNYLRRVSIVTEAANPKIYDVVSLSIATGYVPVTFFDAYYDQSSEQGGVLGTGKMYYVDSSNNVHKWSPNASMTAGTDTKYSFSGTTFSGIVRITLTPAGLLVLQPNKARILKVTP